MDVSQSPRRPQEANGIPQVDPAAMAAAWQQQLTNEQRYLADVWAHG
jgi:hypothetical protein